MRYGHPTLLLLMLIVLGFSAEAQRGGRNDGSNRRPSSQASGSDRGGDLSDLKFQDRLWYGAGGTFYFAGQNGRSETALGLTPQVGYKFSEVLSAGPRVGLTNIFVKNFVVFEDNSARAPERRRYSLLNYSAGGFVRARYRALYVQGEFNLLSFEYAPLLSNSGYAIVDERDEILKVRESVEQLQIGIGYNPSRGGVGSDIGIYYNLFDDVNSVASAIQFRVMLTFKY